MTKRYHSLFLSVWNLSPYVWALLGFLVAYFVFFIVPTFFAGHVMQFFQYLPALDPVGYDLMQALSYSRAWFIEKRSPYIGMNLYPPLVSVLFAPLLFLDFYFSYKLITVVNFLLFSVMTLLFPMIKRDAKFFPFTIFFFITGVYSYGFQFELERGQFNLIAMFLCLLSILLFHNFSQSKIWRKVSYLLFTISVQLKVYPLIFLITLVDDWKDIKSNIRRILGLSVINFVLLFILGPKVFFDFIEAIMVQITDFGSFWVGNHSVKSFSVFVVSKLLHQDFKYILFVQAILYTVLFLCFFLIMFRVYKRGEKGLNEYLLLGCAILALLIPPVSHDYKLSILPAFVSFLLSSNNFEKFFNKNKSNSLPLFILFFAYSSTLFSYTNKPSFLQNNLPALVVILLTVTFLYLSSTPVSDISD